MYRPSNRFPEDVQQQLAETDVKLYDKELRLTVGTVTSRKSRPERRWFSGALALTRTHLIAYAKQTELFNIQLDELKSSRLRFSADNPACLSVETKPGEGQPAMELRFYTPQAERYLALLGA